MACVLIKSQGSCVRANASVGFHQLVENTLARGPRIRGFVRQPAETARIQEISRDAMMSVALFPGDQFRAFQYRVDIVCERRYVFHEMRRKSSGINVKRLVIPGGYVLDTRRIRWRDNHYPSAPFRQDRLLITHLYQRTYGPSDTPSYQPSLFAKLSRPRLMGNPTSPDCRPQSGAPSHPSVYGQAGRPPLLRSSHV